jgi:hypothetical protein
MDSFEQQKLVRIVSTTAIYTQPERDWVGVGGVENFVGTFDVHEVNIPVGATLTCFLETAAERDDRLFKPMRAAGTVVTVGVTNIQVLLAQIQDPDLPVLRWIRWRLELTVVQGPWNVTFRILGSCSPSGGR